MKYIAIRNTEHKGVCEKKSFNKELYKTKNMSYKMFELKEEAIFWAGVKDVKITNTENTSDVKKVERKNENKKKKDVNSTDNKILPTINTAHESILNYKNKGFEGICITTKNFGEIILRLTPSYFIACESYSLCCYQPAKKDLCTYIKDTVSGALLEKERYGKYTSEDTKHLLDRDIEIYVFDNVTKINSINTDYIYLDNFWTRERSKILGTQASVDFIQTIPKEYYCIYKLDNHKDFTLNISEIISIQPLVFAVDDKFGRIFEVVTNWNKRFTKITTDDFKEIQDIFTKVGFEKIHFTKASD